MREVIGGFGNRVVRLVDPQVLVALAGLLVGVVGDPRGVGEQVVGGDRGGDGGPLQLQVAGDRVSRPKAPRSTSCRAATAVNSLVTEAVSKRVCSVQGACQARLAYP